MFGVQLEQVAAFEQDTPGLDIVMAPVGGGGLLSGTALSTRYFSKGTKVIAAEPEMADDAFRSFKSGSFVPSDNPQTIADGLLTSLGEITFPLIKEYVDDIVTVTEENIIKGCQSKVWLTTRLESDRVFYQSDSNTEITKGLISLLIRVLSGQKADDIINSDLYFIEKIGMGQIIGSQRQIGSSAQPQCIVNVQA